MQRLQFLFLLLAPYFSPAQTEWTMKDFNSFWQGFQQLEDLMAELSPEERIDLIYEGVEAQFEGLYVECSADREETGKYHLIISANGNPSYFELIRELVAAQPVLKHFRVTGFRQADADYEGIVFEGLNLSVGEMYFVPLESEDGLAMNFYVPNDNRSLDENTLTNYGAIVIDHVIGEVEFASKIKAYDFYLLEQAPAGEKLIPIKLLGDFLANRK